MGRRRRSPFRLKLKGQTYYTIFAVVMTAVGGLLLLSLTKQGEILTQIYDVSTKYVAWGLLFIPFIFFSISLNLARVKWKLAGFNTTVGLALTLLSLLGLTHAGIIGSEVWISIETLVSGAGALIILSGATVIGLIVLLNTSLGDVLEGVLKLFKTCAQTVKHFLDLFGRGKTKPVFVQEKLPLKVKGGQIAEIKFPMTLPKVPEDKRNKQPINISPEIGGLGTQIVANLPTEQTI